VSGFLLGVVATLVVLALLLYGPDLVAAVRRFRVAVWMEEADRAVDSEYRSVKAKMRAAARPGWRGPFEP
jgi:hypothetical protein